MSPGDSSDFQQAYAAQIEPVVQQMWDRFDRRQQILVAARRGGKQRMLLEYLFGADYGTGTCANSATVVYSRAVMADYEIYVDDSNNRVPPGYHQHFCPRCNRYWRHIGEVFACWVVYAKTCTMCAQKPPLSAAVVAAMSTPPSAPYDDWAKYEWQSAQVPLSQLFPRSYFAQWELLTQEPSIMVFEVVISIETFKKLPDESQIKIQKVIATKTVAAKSLVAAAALAAFDLVLPEYGDEAAQRDVLSGAEVQVKQLSV